MSLSYMTKTKQYFTRFDAHNNNQEEEPGIYYIYEHGRLRSPPGYGKNTSKSEISGDIQGTETKTGTSSKCNKPFKLLDICINFVARHIEYVESLVGFPDLIGKQLFKSVYDCGRLADPSDQTERILGIFSEAYGSLLLENLVFQNCHTQLENCAKLTRSCFGSLTTLNLHGCRIGDDHEMLDFIGNSNCLKQLGLCDNALSDRGLQKMSSPLRVLKRGPKYLAMLDLACNPMITDGGVRYILSFEHLSVLDLSGTKIKVQGLKKIQSSTCLKLMHFKSGLPKPLLNDYHTKGWASEVVHTWLNTTAKNMKKEASQSSSRASASKGFYSRKKIRQNLAENFKKDTEARHITPPRRPILVLKLKDECRNHGSHQHKESTGFNSFSCSDTFKENVISSEFDDNINVERDHLAGDVSVIVSGHLNSQENHRSKKVANRKSQSKLLSLDSAINILTQPVSEENVTQHKDIEVSGSQKRKVSDSSDDVGPVAKVTRRYSVEEQDILGGYFAPSTSPTCTNSLFDAMKSNEWGN